MSIAEATKPRPRKAFDLGSAGTIAFRAYCLLVLAFLIAPLLVIVPLSFNAEPYFTFTQSMLQLDPTGWSYRWYEELRNNPQWLESVKNSFIVAVFSTLIATVLGTFAAIGLTRPNMPYRGLIMALALSPMIVPVIIVAAGMSFVYGGWGLKQTHLGLILAHATLGIPFVVVTMTATLSTFDRRLSQAAQGLGATPIQSFFEVTFPLIMPGLAAGALFAFATSFDELVTVLFLGGPDQVTIPRQMWSGIREQISPAILAAATLLICVAATLLILVQLAQNQQKSYGGMKS
ncbi:MAG TPA: polyamine ABC transporter permease [Alphaproteobacteria bacterium]|nr:polyamine ABC transporter permease [Alphaproteobacteria bacterium]HAJ46024.1 polyamine ABC transporter permease [Alphaproteobacteria bacterium]